MNEITDRVARGVALLDEKLPGWDERIDLDRLDLASDCNCILGQEFGDRPEPYLRAVVYLGLRGLTGADYGFDVTREEEDTDKATADAYHVLTAEWKRVIKQRRAGAGVAR